MSFDEIAFSVIASNDNNFNSSGCKLHQLSLATAIFPKISTQLKVVSTHSLKDSKTACKLDVRNVGNYLL